MSTPRFNVALTLFLGLALAVVGLAGCGGEAKKAPAQARKYSPADAAPAESSDPDAARRDALAPISESYAAPGSAAPGSAAPASFSAPATATNGGATTAATQSKADSATASKGSGNEVTQLVALIDRLARQQPKGTTQQEQLQDFVSTQQQRLEACKKVLALNPDAATKSKIIDAMFEVYQLYGRLGVPGGRQQLAELAKTLARDADPAVARKGRHALFGANVSQLASQQLSDGKKIVEEVQTLLEGEKATLTPDTLDLAGQAADILMQSGLKDDAVAVFELLANAAGGNPQLADRAKRYTDRSKMAKFDLEVLLTNLLQDKADAEVQLVTAVKTLLTEVQPGRELFSNLQQVVMLLEATGHIDAAKACLDEIETAYKDVMDEQLKEAIARSVAGVRKRAGLVGQPFVVEGVTLDGKPFDWSAYSGKVVLVDFWATWCGPCLEELPNIRANFEQFHAQGFEVVGVNLDTDITAVRQFFGVQELPWATVTSQVVLDGKAGEEWSQLPMAAKCGVDAIPFLVLVGKDGKVDSLHVRGPKLRTRLAQLLGEPPPVAIPADPTVPGAAPKAKTQETPKTGSVMPPAVISPVALLMAQAVFAAEPAAPASENSEAVVNPYLAKPGLAPRDLIAYIEKMLDKPKSIQSRADFADAIAEACDRVMAADPPAKEAEFLVAAEAKLMVLHREACAGKKAADEELMATVEKLKEDSRPRIAREVEFFRLEQRVLKGAEAPAEMVPELLEQAKNYLAKEKLAAKHLRLASGTVALINRLEDGDVREQHFATFGEVYAKSSDKQLARYGRKLAKKPAGSQTDLVGKPLELVGITTKGVALSAEMFRGKVVIVDFWATWCGPCLQEIPNLKVFLEKHQKSGLAVVGVSVDEDQEALARFLDENPLGWETLAGEETQSLAEKYGVRTLPTILLVDREGKIAAVAHSVEALTPLTEKLLHP